jgi:hypothetical protein
MKYFINKWFNENTTDYELNNIRDSYWESLKNISNKFPKQIYDLAFKINLHDGIIFKITIDKNNLALELFIRIGDLQRGYENLQLKYSDVILKDLSENELKIIFNEEIEILYDEISLSENGFLHNLLFSDHEEIKIVFKSLEISRKKVPERIIKIKEKVFRVIST